MNMQNVRPAHYLPSRVLKPRKSWKDATCGYGLSEAIFQRAHAEGRRLRLIVGPEDLIPGRPKNSTRIEDYTVGSQNMLYRSAVVLIEMEDGRRWVHKDLNGPQGCWETPTVTETAPDPLQLLAEVSKDLCAEIIANYESASYAEALPEWERLRQVQKVLVKEGRHVPSIVDEVIDIARAHGGLKR